jgi:transposase
LGANTADLHEIAVWLKKCRVKTIALESNGIYWILHAEPVASRSFLIV